jgi:hypothetical protein
MEQWAEIHTAESDLGRSLPGTDAQAVIRAGMDIAVGQTRGIHL